MALAVFPASQDVSRSFLKAVKPGVHVDGRIPAFVCLADKHDDAVLFEHHVVVAEQVMFFDALAELVGHAVRAINSVGDNEATFGNIGENGWDCFSHAPKWKESEAQGEDDSFHSISPYSRRDDIWVSHHKR